MIALIAIWTAGLVAHGVAFPYRLFHIANGENAVGEALSRMYRTDFSRLFPSFIRLNEAAIVASVALVAILAVRSLVVGFFYRLRGKNPTIEDLTLIANQVVALAAMFVAGQRPGRVVQFEDAHVVHEGGELFPPEYTVARFLYRGGWVLHANDSLSFLSRGGAARIDYSAAQPAMIDIGGRVYPVNPASTTMIVRRPAGTRDLALRQRVGESRRADFLISTTR